MLIQAMLLQVYVAFQRRLVTKERTVLGEQIAEDEANNILADGEARVARGGFDDSQGDMDDGPAPVAAPSPPSMRDLFPGYT